jgi:predicted amidohydrolase
LALFQSNISYENKAYNIDIATKRIISAANSGVDLIAMPEMSFTGFSMNTELTAENDNESLKLMSSLAKKYRIAIGFGYTRAGKNKAENVYCIVSPTGEQLCEYVKLHPFSYSGEDKYFTGGDRLGICNLFGFNIGIAICYDLRFPEVFTAMSRQCQLIIVPACWPEKRREHWLTLLKARAIENQLYVAGVNCKGDIGGLHYSGDSGVYNPEGCRLEGKADGELIIYDIANDVSSFRSDFGTVNDKREELYFKLRQRVDFYGG